MLNEEAQMTEGEEREPRVLKDPRTVLLEILHAFERRTVDAKGVVLADPQGLPIVSSFRQKFDLLSVSAMGTLAAQSSHSVFEHLRSKRPHTIVMEGDDLIVVVFTLRESQANFIVVVEPTANLGLVKLEMRAAAKQIEKVLELMA